MTRPAVGSVSLTRVGGGGRTWTLALWVVPFKGPAVIVALPTVRPVRASEAVRVLAGIVTVDGRLRTSDGVAPSATLVSVTWVALSVTVQRGVAAGVRAAGQVRACSVGGGGTTVRAAVAVEPGRAAVTVAVPRVRPTTGTGTATAPAGTVTEDGRPTTEDGSALRATAVLVGWLAFRVRVRVPLLPSVRARVGGKRLTITGAGITTLTWLSAVVPFKEAVIVAVPWPTPKMGNACEVCPAGTVTVPDGGRLTTLLLLVVSETRVSVAWAALSVAVRIPDAPWVTWRVLGRRLVRVGPAGATVTVLETLLPLRLAVMVAVPGATPATGTATVTAPTGTVTVLGTEATLGSLLSSVIGVASGCAALIVAVTVPVPPCVIGRATGSSFVMVGGGIVP
jgi:hypothetical protein